MIREGVQGWYSESTMVLRLPPPSMLLIAMGDFNHGGICVLGSAVGNV